MDVDQFDPALFTLSEVERLAPVAASAYRAVMAELEALLPGREVDAFAIVLALMHRCVIEDRA